MNDFFFYKTQSYLPAVVRNTHSMRWHVEYYVLDPVTGEMVRCRVRVQRLVKRCRNDRERRHVAQSVADEINKKLRGGWSPLHQSEDTRLYTPLRELREKFLQAKEAEGCRQATLVQYGSVTSLWLRWCEDNGYMTKYSGTYLRPDAVRYVDEVLQQGNRHRSYNNTVKVMRSFFQWAVEHCYAKENPFMGLKLLKKEPKIRILVPPDARQKVSEYYRRVRPAMNIVCQLVYASAVRPAELRKIRLKDIDLERHCVRIPGENAKNHKERFATLTEELEGKLREVIEGVGLHTPACGHPSKEGMGREPVRDRGDRFYRGDRGELYLFGKNEELAPGKEPIGIAYFQKSWERMRKATGLPKEMQLYSLRDTGITDLLHAGVDPLTVRHHVDHSSLAIQDIYTDHFDEGVNAKIRGAGVRF